MSIPIIVTTSDAYWHCLPIFFKQYNKFWGDPFTLIGHKKPDMELPDNCTWVSMGPQRGVNYWSDDLRKEFEKIPGKWFVWLFEDSFIKSFDRTLYNLFLMKLVLNPEIGRMNLTTEGMRREHTKDMGIYFVPLHERYRLSSQPSIWNKDFLFEYLTPGLTPWQMELQPTNDTYKIIGPVHPIVTHNEGTTKHNIYKLNHLRCLE